MFRLLVMLFATMFLVLLIGGEDRGQKRLGLIADGTPSPVAGSTGADIAREDLRPGPNTQAPAAARAADRAVDGATLASFVPVSTPQPDPAPAPPFAAEIVPALPQDQPPPLLYVSSAAVNVRAGPSTGTAIIGRLTRHEAVSVVAPEQDGWVRIRIEGDGVDGFIAARLLTDREPSTN